MKSRILRIDWSTTAGATCLMLAALWIRSYWWADYIQIPHSKTQVVSFLGGVAFQESEFVDTEHWTWEPQFIAEPRYYGLKGGPYYGVWVSDRALLLPFWLIMLLPAALAIAPWLRWRFNLRTLLIATTLIAIVLGLAAWLP